MLSARIAVDETAINEAPMTALGVEDAPILQSHWRRFAVTTVVSVLSCALMLSGFAEILISARPAPPPRTSAIVAELVEPPKPPPKPASVAPVFHAVPTLRPAPAPAPLPKRRTRVPPAPPRLKKETHPHKEAPPLPGSAAGSIETGRATVPNGVAANASLHGSPAKGGGSETIGARALYAPTPQIPDDLRENVFSALAVAHFFVDSEGHVKVTLVKATSNPRLNRIILDDLRTWKFFPAIKDGVAVNSEFDLRIPIAVQ